MAPSATTFTGQLSQRDRDFFNKNGFFMLRGFFSPQEKADLVSWTNDIKARPNVPNAHMHYEEIAAGGTRLLTLTENFANHHDGFGKLLRGNKLVGVVDQLMNGPMVLFKEKIIYKLPGGGGFPAHTDAPSYQHLAPFSHVTLVIAIEPAGRENGCLEVVPGSHLKKVPTKEDKCVDDAWCEKQSWYQAEMQTGDIFIFSSFLVHRSAPNAAMVGRAAVFATYNALAEGGDQHDEYYQHRKKIWPATFEREPGKRYKEGYDMYAWATPMGTVEMAA